FTVPDAGALLFELQPLRSPAKLYVNGAEFVVKPLPSKLAVPLRVHSPPPGAAALAVAAVNELVSARAPATPTHARNRTGLLIIHSAIGPARAGAEGKRLPAPRAFDSNRKFGSSRASVCRRSACYGRNTTLMARECLRSIAVSTAVR